MHAGLHVGLALVDLSIWQGVDGGWVIAPRVPLKTVIVERGVVVVQPTGQIKIELPAAAKIGKAPRPSSASEEEFYDQLEQRRPGLPGQLKAFVDSLLELGISPEFRKALVLRWQRSPDVVGSLGYIESTGKVWTADACSTAKRLNKAAAGDDYVQAIARAVGGAVRHNHVVGPKGHIVDAAELLANGEAWKQAIAQFVSAIKPATVPGAECVVTKMTPTTELVAARKPIASAEVTLADTSTAMMPAGKMASARMTTPEVSTAMAAAEVATAASSSMTAAAVTAATMTSTAVTTSTVTTPTPQPHEISVATVSAANAIAITENRASLGFMVPPREHTAKTPTRKRSNCNIVARSRLKPRGATDAAINQQLTTN
jgi:hypothetical protein